MKKFFVHNAFFRLLAPLVYGILAYLLILLINNNVSQINAFFSSEEVYICVALSYLSFELCRAIVLAFDRWMPGKYFRLRLLLQPLLTIIISVGLTVILLMQYFKLYIGFSISTMELVIFGVMYKVSALLYNLLYFSNYYLQRENTVKLAAERNQHHVLELEMTEFRNDINPELLFESLEGLISLMYRDVEKAEAYIDCLASAYRYVLTNRQEELVPVSQELDAARNLVAILNERYFGNLKFESALDEDELSAMLIPGTLPLIVEALVRSTIVSRFEPLIIRCYLEDDYITVQSKLNDRLAQPAQHSALTRLQKSYSLYSDRPMIRVKAYDENYIKLPIINVAEEIALSR
jgi:sensor histidine kinase YesM